MTTRRHELRESSRIIVPRPEKKKSFELRSRVRLLAVAEGANDRKHLFVSDEAAAVDQFVLVNGLAEFAGFG